MKLEFIVNGKFYASRRWENAPRVGDTVLLNRPDAKGKLWCKVTQVIWGDDESTFAPPHGQWVQILCTAKKQKDAE